MWKRKVLLNWNIIRFGQTSGPAHQESRSLNKGTLVPDVQQVSENRKRSFKDWVTGLQRKRASAPDYLKLTAISSGKWHQSLKDTSSRKSASKRTKGQLEGSALTGKTGKPWVAKPGFDQELRPVKITVTWHCEQLRLQTVDGNYS